jgi:peptidyl-prolyl cis-trans isomerase SurA
MMHRRTEPRLSLTPARALAAAFGALVMLGASALLAQVAAPAPATAPDNLNLRFANGIAAIVEGKVITVDDIRREIGPYIPQLQKEVRNEQEFNQRLEALQDDVIQNLVDKILIVKEFYKTKEGQQQKQIPASYVDNAISENIITQFDGDRSKFLAYLRSRGLTLREYRVEVADDLIYGYMRGQQRKSMSIVSPVKVEQFYNENKERFYQEDEVHMRMIQFSRATGETDAQLLARINTAVARMSAGESFEDVAKQLSDTRRTQGGDWGWKKRSDLKKDFSDPLFVLEKGKTTGAILQPEGGYLLYAEDRRYAGIQAIDDVREQIERILIQNMARVSEERWLERLRRNGYVKLY